VSIPSSDEKSSQLHSFPLLSLANECAKCHGLELGKAVDDDVAGNYFVLATVFPASKVCPVTIFFIKLLLMSFILLYVRVCLYL